MSKGSYNVALQSLYKTDIKSSMQSYTSTNRTKSALNKQSFTNQGNNIIRYDSKSRMDNCYKEDRASKLSFYNDIKKEVRACESRGSKGIVGFRNLGNTCFMNSILQCLVRLTPLRDAIVKIDRGDISKNSKLRGNLAMAFKSLVLEVRNSSNYTVISPNEVKIQIGYHSRQFQGYEQQDSAEFFRCILEGLNIDLNRVITKPVYQEMTGNTNENLKNVADRWWKYSLSRDSSVITDLFQGQLSSVITCKDCNYGSVSCDSFLCLNLPSPDSYMRSTSIDQCLGLYFKESHLQSYRCEKCKKKDNCSQKISLYRLPKILVLQLKRFHVDGFRKERLNTEISYPEELNLGYYKNKLCNDSTIYKLHAISHHIGSLYSGHYIADCKEDNRWCCFNDTRVSSIEIPSRSTTAYMLFYIAQNNIT